MMMDCPRCGFAQPKDRYCASCGLDVDAYLAKPQPLLIRILQNPNFHLSLIALAVLLIVGYILFTRSAFVSREVRQMFGTPLTSREAADPNDPGPSPSPQPMQAVQQEAAPPPEVETAVPGSAPAEEATLKDVRRMEMVFYEVAHETLGGLVGAAEKIGESNAGRAYLFKDGAKIVEALRVGSRRVSYLRAVDLTPNAQLLIETPPSTPEPFQFGLAIQLQKLENNKVATLRWDSQMVLSQPETPAELASQTPVMKTVVESNLSGTTSLNGNGLLMIVLEPNNRHPREEYLAKAGDGPWRIFASEDFKANITDWVVLVQLK